MERLSLRLRVFLFFVALALGALAAVAGGLWFGQSKSGGDPDGYILAGLVAGFGILGLVVWIWLLFDENIAKPVTSLAAELRTRAHAGVSRGLDTSSARYLGDLAPAAAAVADRLGEEAIRSAEQIAAETARLASETARLTAALSEVPIAVIMLSEDSRVILYDGQAAAALEAHGPICLGRPIFDYLDREAIIRALETLSPEGRRSVDLTVATADGTSVFEASLRGLGAQAGYMLTLQCEPDTSAQRPLVFDFDLMGRTDQVELSRMPLDGLTYVIFDTETTGLLPDKDEVVQIGAVRMVRGRIIEGEIFDTLVDPGRPIPPTSTKVHGISDEMVRGAPTMAEAGRRFRHFCKGSVLVAHNAPFDMAFLQRDAEAAGVSIDNPVLDTVLLSAAVYGTEASHSLDAIAERLGVSIPDGKRHTALGDAFATAAVLEMLLPVLKARNIDTLGKAIEAMRRHSRLLATVNTGTGTLRKQTDDF